MPKNVQTTTQLCSLHTLAGPRSKPFKLCSNSTCTGDFQMSQLDLEKAQGPKTKSSTLTGPQRRQEDFRKTSTSASRTMVKPLTVWITTNCGKFLRDGNIRPPYLPPEKPVCRSISNSQNWTRNNRFVPNCERSTWSRLYIVTLLI